VNAARQDITVNILLKYVPSQPDFRATSCVPHL